MKVIWFGVDQVKIYIRLSFYAYIYTHLEAGERIQTFFQILWDFHEYQMFVKMIKLNVCA